MKGTFGVASRNKFIEGRSYQRFLIKVTKECNLRCPYCIALEENAKDEIPPVDYDDMNRRLKDGVLLNNCINITGGEPMYDYNSLFKSFDQIDWTNVDKLSILTNGTYYNEDVIDKILTYHPKTSFGISPKIYIEDYNWDVLEKLVKKLGNQAVFSPVMTFESIDKFPSVIKKAYNLGYRRLSLRWDMTKKYYTPFLEAADEIFKELPEDMMFIAPVGNCKQYHTPNLSNQFSISNSIKESFWDFTEVKKYLKATVAEKALKLRSLRRESAFAYMAVKNEVKPYPAQHTDWWSN